MPFRIAPSSRDGAKSTVGTGRGVSVDVAVFVGVSDGVKVMVGVNVNVEVIVDGGLGGTSVLVDTGVTV